MTVTRSTLGRLRDRIARVRAALPPFVAVIAPRGEDESPATYEARRAQAVAPARGRRVFVVTVDRDEEADS